MPFDFSYYILICKLYKLETKKKKKNKAKNVPEVIWSNQEEEFIDDVSTRRFSITIRTTLIVTMI